MADHTHRDQVTIYLVLDALEANNRDRAEAIYHLLDAAGTLILEAERHVGIDAREKAQIAAQYLIDQIEWNAGART